MTDRDRFELEISPGMEPPSGFGDRILVGLAVVALVGGALIAVGNALPDPDEVAQASTAPSARPTRTPRPSPTPVPPRVAALVEPDIEFAPQQPSLGFDGWIRALRDVPIRVSPSLEAVETGVLRKDSIALASSQDEPADDLGWLYLQERGGWIAGTVDGVDVIRRYEYPSYRYSGWIDRVTAGPDGFVAVLSPSGGPAEYEPARPTTSRDGASWQPADPSPFGSWGVNAVAWGPAGWIAAGSVSDDTNARIWLWSSSDGSAWTRLGMLEGVHDEFVTQLLGSDHGYLMETYSHDGSSPSGTLWSSPDGLLWRESTDPPLRHGFRGEWRIAALHEGFYLWDGGGNSAGPSSFAAFSEDGVSWTEVETSPKGVNLRLTSHEGRLFATDLDGKTLATRVWSGVVADRQVIWIQETGSQEAFIGGVVGQLVSDGTRVLAIGWDLATDEALVWTRDAQQWVRASLPDSFGGIPLVAAAGHRGAVVVGYRHSLRGDNPVFWHRSATGRWLPEADPVLPAVPDPSGDDCPALPDEVLEYMVVDAAAAVSCHGATPITFRAYSVECRECWGTMEGNPQPAWLVNPQSDQLWLSPDEAHTDWSVTAVLDPSLVPVDPAWTRAWLEITGHFDDPAAATCHREPVADEMAYWYGVQPLIDQCRMTFVVTEVKLVSPP